jgi:hypothetical protein
MSLLSWSCGYGQVTPTPAALGVTRDRRVPRSAAISVRRPDFPRPASSAKRIPTLAQGSIVRMLVEPARIPGEPNDDPFAARRPARSRRRVPPRTDQLAKLVTSGNDATVNVDDGAGHPACLFREQKRNHVRDVFRGADPAKRMHTGKSVLGQVEFLFRELAEVWRCLHRRWRDRVDPNSMRREFDRERFRQ